MSVPGMNRMLFSEARAKKQERRAFWMAWVVVAVIVTTATHLAAFLIGDRMGYERAAIERAQPKKIVHVANPLTQWQCTKQEGREYLHACAARKRMEAIK